MQDIKFSLVAPAIRPWLWTKFLDSLKSTKISYEVVFVGHVKPDFDTSKYPELRHIYTTCKPSQCTHIGFKEAQGEIVSLTADDAQYFSPNKNNAIDNMYNFIKNFPSSEFIDPLTLAYGFRMFEDQFCSETSHMHYINFIPATTSTPLIYPFFVIYRNMYEIIGGYDNRFITGQAENDFLLRLAYQKGNTSQSLCPTAMVWANHNDHTNSGKFREYHAKDSLTLKILWSKDNQLRLRTKQEIRPYINNDTLYTRSQGETGEWK